MKTLTALALLVGCSVSAFAAPVRDYADVVSVREVTEQVNRPAQRCVTETTERVGAPRERSATGAIVGAIAGGILGNQVGGGSGRALATGAGVIAGAMVGDNLGNRDSGEAPQAVRRCTQEDNWTRVVTGYEVTYQYGGRTYTSVMPRHPGNAVEVEVSVTPVSR